MKLSKYKVLISSALLFGFSSCVGDLDVEPTNPDTKMELTSAEEYLSLLARAYGGLVMEGGISVDDGGAGVYTRQLFNQQELTTDECVIIGWDDAGIREMVYALPSKTNHWVYEMFSRINYQIAVCNAFIRDIDKAGAFFPESEIREMKAEARVLRDLSYYHMIDIFGRGPWTTEDSQVGVTPPTYNRQQLYDAIVNDLVNALPLVKPAAQQSYGRVSREGGYALLAKMYLNAGVYLYNDGSRGEWQKCAEACQEILKTVNTLEDHYEYLFCGDNENFVACAENGTAHEILWTIPQDALTMQTYGGTTYLSGGGYASSANNKIYGLNKDPWQGPHMRPETVNSFSSGDKRALFYAGEFENDLWNLDSWGGAGTCGYQCIKFVYTPHNDYYNQEQEDGSMGEPGTGIHLAPDIFNSADFPLFRVADIYLMLAECQMNGVECNGEYYYNQVRIRAGLGSGFPLPDKEGLLAERNRELYWECHRRSDMIRLGFYTGSTYNWQWKSGEQGGNALPAYRSLMPIPTQFEPTLGQNEGY